MMVRSDEIIVINWYREQLLETRFHARIDLRFFQHQNLITTFLVHVANTTAGFDFYTTQRRQNVSCH